MKTIASILMISLLSFGAMAQSTDRGSDKMDLKSLEDKYWAAKDTDFSVVQNRTYTKKERFFTSISYGPLVNDPWSYGRMTNFAVGYYFNERWGLEVAHEMGSLRDNESTKEIFNKAGSPDRNLFESYTSLNLIVVPFYAKMSFWDRKILYFDMQFAFGVGQANYEHQKQSFSTDVSTKGSAVGFNFDVTQQLFFHENFAVRFDFKNKFTSQEKFKFRESGGGNPSLGKSTVNDTSILFGLTFFY
jgi:outer membrane beta-barrel protein